VLTPDDVYEILNNTAAVVTWVSPYPYLFIALSNLTVAELSAVLQTHFAGIWFILVEATPHNSNGWLPSQFWEYINDPGKAWSSTILADLLKLSRSSLPAPAPKEGLASYLDFLDQGKKK
jgi:hypothetical protein